MKKLYVLAARLVEDYHEQVKTSQQSKSKGKKSEVRMKKQYNIIIFKKLCTIVIVHLKNLKKEISSGPHMAGNENSGQ